MKKVFRICSTFLFILLFSSAQSQETGSAIVKKASDACITLKSVKYFISKQPIQNTTGAPTFKGIITLAKDPKVDHSIFKGYRYHSDINISVDSKKALDIVTSFDGIDLFIAKDKELTKYELPTSETAMRKLGFDLYLLIYSGFVNQNGLEEIGKRELSLLNDTLINGISSYRVKAVTEYPSSPGSKETIKSTTEWFFSKIDYLPTAYSDGKYFTNIQILEKDFNSDRHDFSLLSKDEATYSEKTNNDVLNENLIEVGSMNPQWSAQTLDNKIINSADFEGKVVLVDFWGTWCPPCIKSMPDIQKIHEKYDEVVVIGIAVKDEINKVKNFISNKKFTYTIIPDGTDIAKIYKVAEYPTLYILNTKGEVVYREKGYNSKGFEEWSNIIESLKNQH